MLELFICRHQLHVTIDSVLLGRMLTLLGNIDDLQLLRVVLVGIDELRRGVARHEHDVLSLRLKRLSGRPGRGRWLWPWMERLLVRLTRRWSRRRRRRHQVRCNVRLLLRIMLIHPDRC